MPLKTYRGSSIAALLARAQKELGPDAVIVRVEQRRAASGDALLEVVAGDAETAAQEQRRTLARPPARPAAAPPAPAAPAAPPRRSAGKADVLAFVGPTGAGKTTTVAKLAAHPRVFGGKKVGLLSLDTYRVGAVEQLGTYAELAGRALEVAYEASDLDGCLGRLAGCDIILVDCPGRSPRGQRDADIVRDLLRRLRPVETHLVLPAGLQRELARQAIEHHRARGVTHLLASKVDEYPDDWTAFELAAELAVPMRWLAEGQKVPQDLRSAAARLEATRASRRGRAPARQDVVA